MTLSKRVKNLSVLGVAASLLAPFVVFAQAEDAIAGAFITGFFGIFSAIWSLWALFIFGLIALNIFGIIFWVVMIVDVLKRDFKDDNERLTWILVVILTSWIGAAIYYFMVKSKDKK